VSSNQQSLPPEHAAAPKHRRVVVIGNDRDYFLHHRRPVVERLVELGAEVTVITGGRPPAAGEDSGWTSIHMPIDRLSVNPLRDLRLFFTSLRHIVRLRPDTLHLLTLKPTIFSGTAAVLARLVGRGPERILVTIPGLGRLMSPDGSGIGRFSALARGFVRRAIRFLSAREGVRFSFETGHDRDLWLAEGLIRPDNSTVVNGAGCDPRRFHPDPERRPGGPIRILFASRLLRAKGLDAFVETARRLAGRPGVEFIVAGMDDPGDPDSYPAAALGQEKSVSFLGEVRDMPALLRSVDLVCLPTLYGEGVPRILIEAAASGVACVATDIAGCREIVEDGVTGTLVPARAAGLADALTVAVTAYLDQPERLAKHGHAGLERFFARSFSQDAVVARFIELLLDDRPAERSTRPADSEQQTLAKQG
jgi:glycosyltransferase involved in cell wall biosynthesis